jgi:hypothetical protein
VPEVLWTRTHIRAQLHFITLLADQIISADERTSIQARRRQLVAPGLRQPDRVESECKRRGALQYLCAWDVQCGIPWGRCEAKIGIAAVARLVDQVMAIESYRSAPRVFWIVDNGTSHQGLKSARRLQERYPQPDPGPHADPRVLAQ